MNALLDGEGSADELAAEAMELFRQGYGAIKIKVGFKSYIAHIFSPLSAFN